MTFDQSLAKLAARITKRVDSDSVPLQESIDAFKALVTYYSTLKKNKAAAEDKASEEPDFFSFKSALEDHNGNTEVRDRRGRARDE